jgi:DNA-binding NarL/FixJ family response regulator
MTQKKRVLLVDDHDLFREGLVSLLNSQPDLEVVGQATDGFDGFDQARWLRPDLIIMDITMPLCDGVEATRLIRAAKELAGVRILMLTILEEDEKLFAAVKAGANGYLLKNARSDQFLQAVRGTLAGETTVPPQMAGSLFQEFARLSSAPANGQANEFGLTERQLEVLALIVRGDSDKEIAGKLSLSLHTVKSHVRAILSKLEVSNRRQATQLARERGLVEDT